VGQCATKNLQKVLERREESSLHHDCTIATLPHHFNLVTCYDCCITHTHKLTAEVPDETSSVRMSVEKEGSSKVGSCLAGYRLTAPRIAPTLKTYANSRVKGTQWDSPWTSGKRQQIINQDGKQVTGIRCSCQPGLLGF
jgi:hypothetical protein